MIYLQTIFIIIFHHHDLKKPSYLSNKPDYSASYKNTVSARKQSLIQSNLLHHHGICAEPFTSHIWLFHSWSSYPIFEDSHGSTQYWVQVIIPVFVILFHEIQTCISKKPSNLLNFQLSNLPTFSKSVWKQEKRPNPLNTESVWWIVEMVQFSRVNFSRLAALSSVKCLETGEMTKS